MAGGRLPAAARVSRAVLRVADLHRAVDFYTSTLGFQATARGELSAGGEVLLQLLETPGAEPKPEWATGLYHCAVLLPTRADLGRALRHLLESGTRLQGASDHLVSEAVYLADPDGNGIEIYRDRPREEWPRIGERIQMATDPLEAEAVLAEAEREGRPFSGLPAGTTIGHIHLQVGEIPPAEEFYVRRLGFDVMAAMPSALFLSAGGYHHHVGLNTWTSRGQGPVSGTAGLEEFSLVLPEPAARETVIERVTAAGLAVDRSDGDPVVADPWQNRIRLRVG
ncbi:MAG: VOC family protein [Anaerolineales bacterium]